MNRFVLNFFIFFLEIEFCNIGIIYCSQQKNQKNPQNVEDSKIKKHKKNSKKLEKNKTCMITNGKSSLVFKTALYVWII